MLVGHLEPRWYPRARLAVDQRDRSDVVMLVSEFADRFKGVTKTRRCDLR
jgi:hypothetical protein